MKKAITIFLLLLIVSSSHAQPGPDSGSKKKMDPKEVIKDFDSWSAAGPAKSDNGRLPIVIGQEPVDKKLDSIKLEAWKAYYDYYHRAYKHRSDVFSWQLFSSKLIFFMVLLLVMTGIYFAWLQFRFAIEQQRRKEIRDMEKGATDEKKVEEKSDIEKLNTEFTASAREIKLSSPVLGVIILVLSLLFFYFYLVYVYPINEIF